MTAIDAEGAGVPDRSVADRDPSEVHSMHEPAPDFLRNADVEIPDEILGHARRILNSAWRGRLVIHYDTRDVTLTDINGDTATRIRTVLCEYDAGDPTSTRWSETVEPRLTDASARSFVFTPAKAVGATWTPERFVVSPGIVESTFAASRLLDAEANGELDDEMSRHGADYLRIARDRLWYSRRRGALEAPPANDDVTPEGDALIDEPAEETEEASATPAEIGEDGEESGANRREPNPRARRATKAAPRARSAKAKQ